MPDQMLPTASVSTARPPMYAFDRVLVNRSEDKHNEADEPQPPSVAHQPDALLGVPDRSASASAPPDLEISSRSLFAFKADYSGIFSDIRMDEDYESFYNDNAERTKLPPPLPPPVPCATPVINPSVNTTSALEARPIHHTSSTPLHDSSVDHMYHNLPPSSAAPSSSLPVLPSRRPTSAQTSPSAYASAALPAHASPLRRDDSDASFEDLIFRESRTMRPMLSNPSSYNSSYREEHSLDHQNPATNGDPIRLSARNDQPSLHPSNRPSHHGEGGPFPNQPPVSGPTVRNQYHDKVHKVPARSGSLQSAQGMAQTRLRPPTQPDSRISHTRIRQGQTDVSAGYQYSPAMQRTGQRTLEGDKEQRSILWQLGQMNLEGGDTSQVPSRSVPPVYTALTPAYEGATGDHPALAPQYQYGHASIADPAAITTAATSAFSSAERSSALSYAEAHHSTAATQNWPPSTFGDIAHKPASRMERAMPTTANGSAISDVFSPENRDEAHMSYNLPRQAQSTYPYGPMGSYKDTRGSSIPSSSFLYVSQQNNPSGRMTSGAGSNILSARDESGRNGYGYGIYGADGGRTSSFATDRSRSVPLSPEFLNAQAAAAAAAAAAAVYQSNGVHIGTSGGLGHMRADNMNVPYSSSRGHRGGSRGGDMRRGAGPHSDSYSRGQNHSAGTSRNGNSEQRTSERGVESLNGNGNVNIKFSSFSDVVGRAEELAQDQHGCRFLQTKIEEGNSVYINSIFEECYDKFVDLMTDPFGNYLCQKLFEFCNDAQRLALVERCASAIPQVSTNMHGTRAVQRMVECLSTPDQVRAVCNALKPAAVSLMKDINGNHVIQRCLHRMDPAQNQFVYDAVAANCFELATHRHGCCVMQRCMDFASPMQRNQLAQQINANALPLVQNAFGNYVVQYVLDLNDPAYTAEVLRRLRGHLAELSMQKFSSNVVEKGLDLGSREMRRDLIDELISDQETMRMLLHDAYGNYVIQRALQTAEGPQLECICEAIRPHLHSLKQSPYGKRIQAKIMKRMPKGIAPLSPST